jgi:hypothetical protein
MKEALALLTQVKSSSWQQTPVTDKIFLHLAWMKVSAAAAAGQENQGQGNLVRPCASRAVSDARVMCVWEHAWMGL